MKTGRLTRFILGFGLLILGFTLLPIITTFNINNNLILFLIQFLPFIIGIIFLISTIKE